ncbi:MAG: AraC family transcriptional regulator [Bacteroidota bacterium]
MNNTLENAALFAHVVNGRSKIYAPVKSVELHSGDSLIMKCDKFVNNWFANNDNSFTEVILFQLKPEILHYIYENKVPDFVQESPITEDSSLQKIPPNDLLIRFAKEISYYIDHPQMMKEELIKVKTRELIFLLTETDHESPIKNVLRALFYQNDYKFKHIIEANIFENLNLEDLAFMAGLSLSSFQRRFKDLFKTTPRKYINAKRLEKAKYLLETTNTRVNDIAYSCGFQDVAYFSNTFSATFSTSPSNYRKRHLK